MISLNVPADMYLGAKGKGSFWLKQSPSSKAVFASVNKLNGPNPRPLQGNKSVQTLHGTPVTSRGRQGAS